MKIDLTPLNDMEIINLYSDFIVELKKRKIIRSKNLLGDLGEYLAIDYYCKAPGLPNLQAAPPGTQNVDALSRKGDRYSIKSTSGKLTSVFYGLNDPDNQGAEVQKFEFVIIVLFADDFKLDKIIEISWNQFLNHKRWHNTMRGWNLSINKKLVEDGKIIYKQENI